MDAAELDKVSGGLNPQPLPPGGMQASPWAVNVSSAAMQDFHFQGFNRKPGG
jgi:hypothetical protein